MYFTCKPLILERMALNTVCIFVCLKKFGFQIPFFTTVKVLVLRQPVSCSGQEEIVTANLFAWRNLKESFILGLISLFPWAEDKEIYS